jgi:hypothetical protein
MYALVYICMFDACVWGVEFGVASLCHDSHCHSKLYACT